LAESLLLSLWLSDVQVYSILGKLYPSDAQSAPAMALFKFFQVSVQFSSYDTEYFHLLVMGTWYYRCSVNISKLIM